MLSYMTEELTVFADRLKNARERAGLKQPDVIELLAEKGIDLGQSRLSHYENGRSSPDPMMMAALADAIGVSVDYLVGLTNDTTPAVELSESLVTASGGGRINQIMTRLSKDRQRQLMEFAEFLLLTSADMPGESESEEWRQATEVFSRRLGLEGEREFLDYLSLHYPDLALALGIVSKHKSVQSR